MDPVTDPHEITPVIKTDSDYYSKCDNMFEFAPGFKGIKARGCLLQAQGQNGLVTIHSEEHPQGPMVAATAKTLGIPCRIHTTEKIARNLFGRPHGAVVIPHSNEDIMSTAAKADARLTGFRLMAVNMDCTETYDALIKQCQNIPPFITTVVIPSKSGMTALPILQGLLLYLETMPELRIITPNIKNVKSILDIFGPEMWEDFVTVYDTPIIPIENYLTDKDLLWLGNQPLA